MSIRGTVLWMAPEVIRSFGNGTDRDPAAADVHWEKADVWSVGCTVVEMVTAQSPWALCNDGAGFGNSVAALEHITTTTSRPPVPDSLGGSCLGILYRCFLRDPRRRPGAADLLLDPFVAAAVQIERRRHWHPRPSPHSTRHATHPAGPSAVSDGEGAPPQKRRALRGSRRASLRRRVPVLDFSKLPREAEIPPPLYKDGVNVARRIAAGKYVKKKSRSRAQHAFLSALTQGSQSPRSPSNSSLSSIASQTSDGEGAAGIRRNRAQEPDADNLATAGWRPNQRSQRRGASNAKGRGQTSSSISPFYSWPMKPRGAGGEPEGMRAVVGGSNRAFAPLQFAGDRLRDQGGKGFASEAVQQRGDRAHERPRLNAGGGRRGAANDYDEETLSVASAISVASAPTRGRNRDGDVERPHSARLVFDFRNGDWRRDGSGRRSATPPSADYPFDGGAQTASRTHSHPQ